jgi:hypothetical protein
MPMGGSGYTAQVSSGNVRTTVDPVSTTLGTQQGAYITPTFGVWGLKNPLGMVIIDSGGLDSVSGTTTQLPVGQVAIYKYVLYKSAANPALVAQPAPVYYTDNTYTIVSGKASEALASAASNPAGLLMPNTTDMSGLTATILNNGGNGSGVWICTYGFVKGAAAPASTAAGDILVGSGDFAWGRLTAFAAATVYACKSLTALASSASDQFILLSQEA